jgi:hypothetical protein
MKFVNKTKMLSILLILLMSSVPITCSKTFETVKPETAGLSSETLAGIDNIFNLAVSKDRIKGIIK